MYNIRLESIDPSRNRFRCYLITICPTIWGDWATVCEWGRIGEQPRGVRVVEAGDLDGAELGAAEMVERRLRRGYRVK